MKTARIIFPVYTLGPGKRAGIWLSGCDRRCYNCANPELWDSSYGKDMTVDEIMEIISKISENDLIDGFTISGGEPFKQARELMLLLERLSVVSEDILVFTGFRKEELGADLSRVAVLVDGEYRDELNENHILKGSENQHIHFLKEKYREPYEKYIAENSGDNFVQPVPYGEGMLFLGIQGAGFRKELSEKLTEKGIEER